MGILTVKQLSDEIRAGRVMAHAPGEEVTLRHGSYGEMPFVIIGRNQETLAGEQRPHITIRSKYAFELRPFDLPTLKHPWGSNDYEKSFINGWLHGKFLVGIEDATNCLAMAQKRTANGKIAAMAFLLSTSELGFKGPNIADEGAAYEYYAEDDNERRRVTYPDGEAAWYWTRSPFPSNADYERVVHPSGALYHYNANSALGAVAGLVII